MLLAGLGRHTERVRRIMDMQQPVHEVVQIIIVTKRFQFIFNRSLADCMISVNWTGTLHGGSVDREWWARVERAGGRL